MKKIPVIIISSLLLFACGSNKKEETQNSFPSPNYINTIENSDGFSSAYTEDGHTIIYETDSASNYIVYYAKFDDNAGKKGYDRVKDKAIRLEIDTSMNMLTSFVSAYGGASFQVDDNGEYHAYYYDEQMNGKNVELHGIRLVEQLESIDSPELKIKRIIYLLTIAHDIAKNINEGNIGGWNYIVYALEQSHSISNLDVMAIETVYDPKVKEHISKLSSTKDGLTHLHILFQKKVKTKL